MTTSWSLPYLIIDLARLHFSFLSKSFFKSVHLSEDFCFFSYKKVSVVFPNLVSIMFERQREKKQKKEILEEDQHITILLFIPSCFFFLLHSSLKNCRWSSKHVHPLVCTRLKLQVWLALQDKEWTINKGMKQDRIHPEEKSEK